MTSDNYFMKILRQLKRFVISNLFNEHDLTNKRELERDSQLAALRARRLEEFRYLHWR
jgi:hypothetical protein